MDEISDKFVFVATWLNANSGLVMTALTAVYVLATIWIVLESRKTNRLQSAAITQSENFEAARYRPYITFSIDTELRTRSEHDTDINLVANINNIGLTPAYKVSIRSKPDFVARVGWENNNQPVYRTPSILHNSISQIVPNKLVREYIGPASFLYEDNPDDKLVYEITIDYYDINDNEYRDHFTIDLGASRDHINSEDIEGKFKYRLLGEIRDGVAALKNIADTLDSPDRSRLFTPIGNVELNEEQLDILKALVEADLRKETDFIIHRYFGEPRCVVMGGNTSRKITGLRSDFELLARAGFLNGYYRSGMFQFTLSDKSIALCKSLVSKAEPK